MNSPGVLTDGSGGESPVLKPPVDHSLGIPLIEACRKENVREVRELLDTGADIEAKDTRGWGRTPLSWAAENGNSEIVRLLLDLHADIEAKDRWGRRPLTWAAKTGKLQVMQLLEERGAKRLSWWDRLTW